MRLIGFCFVVVLSSVLCFCKWGRGDCVCVHVYLFACERACVCVCVCICLLVRVCARVHARMRVCVIRSIITALTTVGA